MQGVRFARIVVNARDRLRVKEIVTILAPHLAGDAGQGIDLAQRDRFSAALLLANHELHSMFNDSTETAQVLQGLGIPQFFEAPTLGALIGAFHSAGDSNTLRSSPQFWRFRNLLANLEALDRLANTVQHFLVDARLGHSKEDGLVEFSFLGREGEVVTLEKLAVMIETIQSLHDDVSRAEDDGSVARLGVIESGSDLLIALLSKAKTAGSIAKLCSQWWDRVKYRDLHDFDRKMESATKGIALINELDKLADKQGIEGEKARNLRHSVLDNLMTLTGLGIKLSEPERTKTDRPLLEQKRDVRLLKGSSDSTG